MILRLGKFEIFIHLENQDEDAFPRPIIGFSYFATWFHSMPLWTLLKSVHRGPQFNLYFFIGSKILNVHFEYRVNKEPILYSSRSEMKASLGR